MKTTKAKRIWMILGATVALLGAYFASYFAWVSVQFITEKEKTFHRAAARYEPALVSKEFAQWFFEPARLIDATYQRPKGWQDYQDHPSEVDMPLPTTGLNHPASGNGAAVLSLQAGRPLRAVHERGR